MVLGVEILIVEWINLGGYLIITTCINLGVTLLKEIFTFLFSWELIKLSVSIELAMNRCFFEII